MNLLPLESFRQTFTYHPWRFWQLSSAAWFPVNTSCADLIYEYGWQADNSAGRADIRDAIETAEGKLRDWLKYSPAPHFVTETLQSPRFFDHRLNRINYSGSDGRWLALKLGEGKILQAGVETRAIIGNALLVYSDADGDGLNDTFTTAIATTATDSNQIEAMFTSGDRLNGAPVGDEWTIKPLQVTISGGMATIKGRAWQAVKPVRYESGAAVDPANAGNFATSLDIYRHYCDPTGTTQDTAQAELIWETRPWPYWATCYGCGTPSILTSETDPAAYAKAIARVGLRDAENGIVSFGEAIYDTTQGTWGAVNMSNCRPPDRIVVRYQAGEPLVNGQVAQKWRDVIAKFGAAELNRRVCVCEGSSRAIYNQQIDHSFSGDARVEKFTMTESDNASPFGYRSGQLNAWRSVRSLRQLIGLLA
jgi:hypothetical protein